MLENIKSKLTNGLAKIIAVITALFAVQPLLKIIHMY